MTRLDAIQSGEARDRGAAAARALASAAVPVYRAGLAAHQSLYRTGLKQAVRLPRPVISVGNLTTGGTGKTPMVAWLGRALLAMDKRPAVLMRGYAAGRGDGRSDEARELAARLGEHVPILAHPDRATQARRLLDREPGIDVLLLDDGFQHYRLRRDLDLVLIDALNPWAHGLLPRGRLREPRGALGRADAVIVTRSNLVDADALATLDREIATHHGKPPIAHATVSWSGLRRGGDTLDAGWLDGRRVTAVCGLGNPHAFYRMVEASGARLTGFESLPDHHAPTAAEIEALLETTRHGRAEALLTTEKDYVKWIPRLPEDPQPPVIRPVLETDFADGEAALCEAIARTLA
mgnify:CR=1 FL=1